MNPPANLSELVERAYSKALKFLSYRPRSQKEIEDFLVKKKFDKDIIAVLIERLIELKFVNDEDFAKWWIEQRQQYRARSKRVIKQELRFKGIAQELIEKFLDEGESDFAIALAIFNKRKNKLRNLSPDEFKKKTIEFLQRRGFSWDIIKEVIKKE